jgi:hypothetical protein
MASLTNWSLTDPTGHRAIRGRAVCYSLTGRMDRQMIRGRAACTGLMGPRVTPQSDSM